MKLHWTMAVALWLGVSAGSVHAGGFASVQFSRVSVDPRLAEVMRIEGGMLLLDRTQGQVLLTLDRAYDCRSEICAPVMPEPIQVKLPVVSTEKDDCGRIIIRAARATLSGFTGRQSVVIVDSQNSVCGGTDPQALTRVTLETRFQDVATQTVLEGPALQEMPQILPIQD